MDRSEEKTSAEEMLRRGQEEDGEVRLVSLVGRECEGQEELQVSDTDDEEEQGSTPLISACRKGMNEVSYVYVCLKETVWHL